MSEGRKSRKELRQAAQRTSGKRKSKKTSGRRRLLQWGILAVALAVFIFSGIQLLNISGEYEEADKEYQDLEQLAPLPQEEEAGPEDRQVDFAALAQKNSEIVGWIYIPDSKVDYPMVKGTDNSYYVSHTFEKKANGAGAIFLDWKNKGDFSDRNTVIYGHHMKNGSMFAALVEYKDPDYFNAHRTIYLYTPQGVYTATVFSAYVDVATGPQTTISFQDDAAFLSFVETMRNQSITKTDTPIGAEDRIITLSTCTYEYDDARFIVQAVLHPVKTTGE